VRSARAVAAAGRRGVRGASAARPTRGRPWSVRLTADGWSALERQGLEARARPADATRASRVDQPAAWDTWSWAVCSADLMSASETLEPVAILANMSFIALPTVDSNWSSAGTSGSGFALLL
jgi:hypothetical protein